MYGAGMTPLWPAMASKTTGSTLKLTGSQSGSGIPANILPPTEKMRSLPHFTSSVAPGRARQNEISGSTGAFPARFRGLSGGVKLVTGY
jgi:hypothetical protein